MRYPLQPLLDASRLSEKTLRQLVGAPNGARWQELKEHGLSHRRADRWAICVGLFPSEVWGDWYHGDGAGAPEPSQTGVGA